MNNIASLLLQRYLLTYILLAIYLSTLPLLLSTYISCP